MDYVGGIAQNIGCLWKCNPLIIRAIGSGVNSLFLYRGGFAAQVGRRRRAIPTLGERWALSRRGAAAPSKNKGRAAAPSGA
jgi:hypothetical protein